MNMNKSYIITFFLGCFFATQADASNKLTIDSSDRCQILVVHISKNILDHYNLSRDLIVLNNGFFRGCHKTLGDEQECQFEQDSLYGPDATLSFKRKTGGHIASIRVQQNLCFFEAGNITVEPIRGKWLYRFRGGAWSVTHGNVWLDQVLLDN